jgi:hypothetical protein
LSLVFTGFTIEVGTILVFFGYLTLAETFIVSTLFCLLAKVSVGVILEGFVRLDDASLTLFPEGGITVGI